jgi:hypothetical protein
MTLQQFADSCHRLIEESSGPAGRQKVCALLQEALGDEAFVAAHLGDDVPERKILYEDPELGFCILAHVYRGPKESQPHDHGPTWAIYGQAVGETVMTDWSVVTPATKDRPAKVKLSKSYKLKPGDAHLYPVGAIHAPMRDGPTRLIRIEGKNTEHLTRTRIEPV